MTTPTLITRSTLPRTPFSNITNYEYQTTTTRVAIPLKKPESVSTGLQETYEQFDPFNFASESFYCPQIVYDFPCFDDLDNFSIYRKSSAQTQTQAQSHHKRSQPVSFSPNDLNTPLSAVLFGRRGEEERECKWEAPSTPKLKPSLEVGILITPPTPPKLPSPRLPVQKECASTPWLSEDDWNMTDRVGLEDAYGGISDSPRAEDVWWK
ncbi:hypothetical protein V5O48_004092 [Marasmius crinis-equi]|uniref:Uncharacterized protein n=1 Tax=Marasmius crinis-equi TaxID=585013 RepID=A0ABR3FRB1_9AGAR